MFTNVDNFKTVEIVRYLDKAGAGGGGRYSYTSASNMREGRVFNHIYLQIT